MAVIIDRSGQQNEILVTLDDQKAAIGADMNLARYLRDVKCPDYDPAYGEPFEQLCLSEGVLLRRDPATGRRGSTVGDLVKRDERGVVQSNGTVLPFDSDGRLDPSMGAIVRNDGSNALTISGRLLFANTLLAMVDSVLYEDLDTYVGTFSRLVATTTSVDTPRVDWPTINSSAPRGVRSQPIAQLAEPANMVSITLGEKSVRMPRFAIGLEISAEAESAVTLDLVGIIVRQQAAGERIALVNDAIKYLIAGSVDWGMPTPIASTNLSTLDSAVTPGNLTHRAWLKCLRVDKYRTVPDWVVGDIDTYLAYENRAGRPIITQDAGQDGRLTSTAVLQDPRIPSTMNWFEVDSTVLGTMNFLTIDSRISIRKWVYTGAQYQALEDYVMRRSRAMRIDFGEMYGRLMEEGFHRFVVA